MRKFSSETHPKSITSRDNQESVKELSKDIGTNTSTKCLVTPRIESKGELRTPTSSKTDNMQKKSKPFLKDASTQFPSHKLSILPMVSSEHSKSEIKPTLRKMPVEKPTKEKEEPVNSVKKYKSTMGVQADSSHIAFESDKKHKNTKAAQTESTHTVNNILGNDSKHRDTKAVQTDLPENLETPRSETSIEEETTNIKYQKRSPMVPMVPTTQNTVLPETPPKTSMKTIQTDFSFVGGEGGRVPRGCYCEELTQTENNETLTIFPPSHKNRRALLVNNDGDTNSDNPLCTDLDKSFSESQVSELKMFGQVKEGKKILQVDFERHHKTNCTISTNTSKANDSNSFDSNDGKLPETPIQITSFSTEKANPSPVSDLSDLIKIIDRCFDKMTEFKEGGRCQCFVNSNSEFYEKPNLEKNSQQVNIRQSVPLNKQSNTSEVLICKICLNKIKIFTEDKSTTTENEMNVTTAKKVQNNTESKSSISGEQKRVRDSSIPVPRKPPPVSDLSSSSGPRLPPNLKKSPENLTGDKNSVAFNEGTKKNSNQGFDKKPNSKPSSRSHSQTNSNTSKNTGNDSNDKQIPSTSKSNVEQQRKPPRSSKSHSNSFTYSVIVSPMWPKQMLHNLQEKAIKHLCKKKPGKKYKTLSNEDGGSRTTTTRRHRLKENLLNDDEINENSCFILRPTKSECWSHNYVEENVEYDECVNTNTTTSCSSKNRKIKSANFFWIPAFSTNDTLNNAAAAAAICQNEPLKHREKHKEKTGSREKNKHGGFNNETCYGDHVDSDSVHSSYVFEEDKLYTKSCASIIQDILTYFHEKTNNSRPLENINEKDGDEVAGEQTDFTQSNVDDDDDDTSENES